MYRQQSNDVFLLGDVITVTISIDKIDDPESILVTAIHLVTISYHVTYNIIEVWTIDWLKGYGSAFMDVVDFYPKAVARNRADAFNLDRACLEAG